MLKLLVKASGFIAGLVLSGTVCAVGMGGINVATALGQPLKAEIGLVAVGKAEQGSLSARLASPDVFKGAGMDYPASLPTLKFHIETRADGESYIRVTSVLPVNEPVVSLLVELSWPSGKLLREYTFLLDPPNYMPEQPEAAEVKPVLSKIEEANEPIVATVPITTAPADEKVFAEAPSSAPAEKSAEVGNVASGAIKVKRGDTLSRIAREAKPADISLERMLVALYRANADVFDGKNMNRLRTGKILRMPEQSDVSRLTQVDAVMEIRAQVVDWNAYRQKLAAASVSVAEETPRQEASGKISTAVTDKAPAAKESAKEVVRLSKGEAPGDKAAAGGNAKTLQDKIHVLEEEAIARSKALKESSERIAMLEKNIKDMQHLIELKGQPTVLAKPVETKPETKPKPETTQPTSVPAVPVAADSPPVIAAPSAVAPASAVKPATPPKKPVAAPKIVAPPPSMLDEPLYVAGGAAALLALGGLGFVLARRRKAGKAEKDSEISHAADDGSASSRISAPPAASPENGDFTNPPTSTHVSPVQPEDTDPISEADLFLNFGRDAQAEEILKDALEKNPANNQVRLKLLSIYANRKDLNLFSSIARQVQDSDDAAAWAQAAEMGRNMEPNNPMYGGKGGESVAAKVVEQAKKEQQPASGLDFDLGFSAPETAATTTNESNVDFDLGIGAPEATATPENESTMVLNTPLLEETGVTPTANLHAAPMMDFDITATHPSPAAKGPEQAATITPNLDDMVFDITSSHPSQAAITEEKAAATSTPNLDDLVFDITSSHPLQAAITEEKTGAGIAASADHAMEFTLDFPTTGQPGAAPGQAAPKKTADIDFGDISLNLDEPAAPAAPATEIKDAHWHDVATKLDLAKAYQEMGDNAGAREILEEVLAEGDAQQRAAAESVLQQLLA